MIDDAYKRKHAAMSDTWGRFLEFAERNPELARPLDAPDIQCSYPVQAWPTFINAQRRREIADATVGVFRVLQTIPYKIFDADPARFGQFYGVPAGLARHLMSAPDGLESAIGRGDFLDGEAGFKCVEFNPYGNLGGFETEFISQAYVRTPAFARFVRETGADVRSDRLVLALFEHFIRETRRLGIAENEINVAAIVESDRMYFESNAAKFSPVYAEALSRIDPALSGQMICCRTEDVGNGADGTLSHGDRRVHAIWELGINERCPPKFYFPFKARKVAYFNSLLTYFLGDKRNLSLLSRHADDEGRFTPDERRIIHRHVPWSRNVEDTETTWDGIDAPLIDLVQAQRTRLVLKKGFGMKGEQVVLGPAVSAAEWDDTLRIALRENDWIVQEYIEPRSYLYQHGAQGTAPFRGVWGTFCFGGAYAGAYLRISPEARLGPINSAQGAMTGLVFVAP